MLETSKTEILGIIGSIEFSFEKKGVNIYATAKYERVKIKIECFDIIEFNENSNIEKIKNDFKNATTKRILNMLAHNHL